MTSFASGFNATPPKGSLNLVTVDVLKDRPRRYITLVLIFPHTDRTIFHSLSATSASHRYENLFALRIERDSSRSGFTTETSFRAADNRARRRVSSGCSVKDHYSVSSANRNQIIERICCYTRRSIQPSLGTLYDPYRRFFSTGAASKDQNSFCKWIGRNDLIMDRIYRKIMRRTRNQGCLSFKDS